MSKEVSYSPNTTELEKPRLWTAKFIIILSVFLFLTCIGLPVWHYSTRAKRISIRSYLNINSTELEWNQYNIVKFSQELFDKNVSNFVELDEHFEKLVLSNGIKIISKNIEWKDEWRKRLEELSQKYGKIAQLKAWLSEECFERDEESEPEEFTAIDPVRGSELQYTTDIRVTCVNDVTEDAIYINRRGEMKLYTPKKAFVRRLNAFARAILRIRQSPNIKQELKKVTLHIVNLDPRNVIISDFPEEWSLNKWLLLKRLQAIYGEIQMKDDIMFSGHIPGWKETGENSTIIHARDMQYLLNENVRWNFEAPNDPDHQIHFLILVSPNLKNVTLLDYDNQETNFNAFTIPRWGGVAILSEETLGKENLEKWQRYKLEQNTTEGFVAPLKLRLSLEEMQYFVEIMTSQLRDMLGVIEPEGTIRASPELQSMIRIIPDQRSGITGWELMLTKRRKAIEFSYNTARSLTSLIKIIDNMPDVMVDVDVVSLAKESLKYLKIADDMASKGQWSEAVVAARMALEKAEEAFYHPTLVSRLYFPLSQKLAVFLPFILPITITVTIALLRELSQYFSKRRAWKKQKAKEE